MENIAKKIFKKLKTKERANDFLVFSDFFESFDHYVGDVNFNDILKEKLGQDIPDWFQDVLQDLPGFEVNKYDKEKVLEIIKIVRDMIKESEVIKFEMSFEPSKDFVDKALISLEEYYSNSGDLGKNILLDFDFKDIGESGALVYMDGKFLDLTLKNQVLNYLASKDVINRKL